MAPVDAPMIAAGLPFQALSPWGREAQSIAFFNTPDTDQLYSGVTNAVESSVAAAATEDWTTANEMIAAALNNADAKADAVLIRNLRLCERTQSLAVTRREAGQVELFLQRRLTDLALPNILSKTVRK
jgi:hypothetical protein